MATTERMQWLLRDKDEAFRAHIILGDQIALPGGAWLAPGVTPVSGGTNVLILRYGSPEEGVTFCMPRSPNLGVEEVLALRELASIHHAEQTWGPFADRLGYPHDVGTGPLSWQEENVVWGDATVRVRRPRHPNFLFNQLMLRERENALAQLRAASREPLAEPLSH